MSSLRHGHTWGKSKNGKSGGTPTYYSWLRMKRDVLNPDSHNYEKYGGSGITIYEPWLIFINFLADVGERPIGKTLDRWPNPQGNYEPCNVRWATPSEQARNRRTNHLITYDGRTQPLVAWAEEMGISRLSLRSRLREGWDVERALLEPVHDDRFLTFKGTTQRAADWAKQLNIKPHTILARIRRGWSVERALSETITSSGRWPDAICE